MEALLSYLPLVALLVLAAGWAVRSRQFDPEGDWRTGVLSAMVLWFAFIWLSTEVLGFFRILTHGAVLAIWLVFLIGSGYWLYRSILSWNKKAGREERLPRIATLTALFIAVILLITFAVALVSPPNNNDSISYHLPRVMHWIQNRSVDFYPTVISRQLFMPPLAEYGLLHMIILGESDASLGLVQWAAFVGAVIGVSLISRRLGVNRQGQWLSALFVATLPMALLQSTSTQTDLITAFFAITLVERIHKAIKQKKTGFRTILFISTTTALGMYTKGTFAAFCIPFLVLLGVSVLRKEGFKKALFLTVSVVLIFLVINIPLLYRNLETFGNILGPGEYISSQQGIFLHPMECLSNLIKNFSFHISSPFGQLDQYLEGGYVKIHEFIGVDLNATSFRGEYHTFSLEGFSNNEDHAGNPLHFLIFSLMVLWLILGGWKKFSRTQKKYMGFWTAAWILFSFLFPWQPWGSRLQLSLFIIGAPLVPVPFSSPESRRGVNIMAPVLFMACIPWLLFNQIRPVFGLSPFTSVESVFSASRNELMHANRSAFVRPFNWLEQEVYQLHCDTIGMKIDSSDPEYLIWIRVPAPFHENKLVHMENLFPSNIPDDSADNVCAVICLICDDEDVLHGLPYKGARSRIRLYTEPQP